MEKELEEAKAEIERLKTELADKETIIQRLSVNDTQSSTSNLGDGGNVLEEVEDRHRKVADELKWKVEQFQHLEEAHDKLKEEFQGCKDEWGKDKSTMIDEINKLQESFDEGNRAADELKRELTMCKQALENEETRRTRLEEQLSEMKEVLENATHEGFDGKMEVESSAAETGEEDVANLRHSLQAKEMEYKDMEYKAKKLEKENQELLTSLKELQEAHIPRAVATPSSWVKLKNRLKTIEQSHRECTASLRAKEAEWNSKAERIAHELKRCTSILKMKDEMMDELKQEIESSNAALTQMKMQNEELSLMLQLMKTESSEEKEGGVAQLMDNLQKEREERLGIEEELNQLREEIEEVREALDMVDAQLTEQTNEKRELELELENWKSVVGHLERQVTGNHSVRRELELSLLAQAEIEEMLKQDTEEKEKRIGNLEHQIFLMDQEIRIEEEDETDLEEDEKVTQRLKMDDGERLQLELLAKELEEAIITHIMGEKNNTIDQSSEDDMTGPAQKHEIILSEDSTICTSKENVNDEHDQLRNKSDSIVEERSPFRELN